MVIMFDCPQCDVHFEGDLELEQQTVVQEYYALVPMWPGGPPISDVTEVRSRVMDRVFRTNACSCAFSEGSWSWVYAQDGERGSFSVQLRQILSEEQARG